MTPLFVVPVELDEANALVELWHRHARPVVGHRFSLGCVDELGELHGAAIVARPISRKASTRDVVEVSRLVTDGTRNACSLLYAASARAAQAIGYRRIQTFVLDSELGTSLRAAGWTCDGPAGSRAGQEWRRTDGAARRADAHDGARQRWSRNLAERPDVVPLPLRLDDGAIQDELAL